MNTSQDQLLTARNSELEKELFEKTLELQEKNREIEIEAALEKVRSRSLAIDKSNELKEVVTVLFEKLKELQIPVTSAGITIFPEGSKDMNIYVCGQNDDGLVISNYLLPYFNHPICNDFHNAREKHLDFFVGNYSKDEKNSFYEYVLEFSSLKDLPNDIKEMIFQSPKYSISMATVNNSMIAINDFEGNLLSENEIDIIKRFARVFEQAYTRFLDLQNAEAQVRESQIQLALERVRARTMAMQKSDELQDTATLLFQQANSLSVTHWACGFNIYDDNGKTATSWMASDIVNGIGSGFKVPVNEHIYEAAKSGEPLYIHEIKPADIEAHYKYMFTLPVAGDRLKAFVASGGILPTIQILHTAFFMQGYLMFITQEPVPEMHDIFKRFGKVFEQTYTRFLDLQRAEAQAREAQIEAALERVRSRSMGMQKSEELKEVIQVVYEQFVHLNINVEHTGFVMDYKARDDYDIWIADQLGVPSHVTIPYFDCVYYNRFNEAKKKGEDFFASNLDFEEKNRFYKKIIEYVPGLPEETKEFLFSIPGLAGSTVLLDNVCLYIENFSGIPYSDEENAILMRFGKVFEQSYTRFNDLQKAEAQAREAKIEAALERTRTQSMLMQHSNELDITSRVFHEQLLLLGIDTEFSYVWLPDDENEKHLFWAAWNEEENGSNVLHSKSATYDLVRAEPYTAECLRAWKSGEPVHIYFIAPTEVKHFFDIWSEIMGDAKRLKPEFFPEGMYYDEAFMKYGCLGINIGRLITDDEKKILLRFSIEFERTYTRFLDLKKAEAQATEAQIQLALERVRARAMAMQSADELIEVANVMRHQMVELGQPGLDTAAVHLYSDNSEYFDSWYAFRQGDPVTGNLVTGKTRFKKDSCELLREIVDAYYSKRGDYSVEFTGIKLREWFALLGETVPDIKINLDNNFETGVGYFHMSDFSGGSLVMATIQPPTQEAMALQKRCAAAFDLAYRRYLDLQKAEAQARESQIQLALERVRARTMAMQKSEELAETAGVLFQQLYNLDIVPERVFVGIPIDGTQKIDFWGTEQGGHLISTRFEVDSDDTSVFSRLFKAWKDKKPECAVFLKGKDLDEHINYIANIVHIPVRVELVQEQRIIYTANFSRGILLIVTPEVQSEETQNILQRFAAVFDQTYTRFLDLQKAEAQAKEAQIETSLERVRSKTMAMHSSDDVTSAIATMFTELDRLGIENMRCGIAHYLEDHKMEVWSVSNLADGKVVRGAGLLDTNSIPFWKIFYSTWQKKEDFLYYLMAGKEKEDYFRKISTLQNYLSQSIEDVPDLSIQTYYFPEGSVWAFSLKPHSEEDKQVMKRFASVFSLTFRRYQDLKKAEAQAREATIEAALEKVRSSAMAMHSSNDISSTTTVVFEELKRLNIHSKRCGVALLSKDSHAGHVYAAATSSDGKFHTLRRFIEMTQHHSLQQQYESWIKQENYIVEMRDEELRSYYQLPFFYSSPDYVPPTNYEHTEYGYYIPFSEGLFYAWTEEPYSEDEINILNRFKKIVDLTFRRYFDLQKAEAQAREATIEAALEKVRGKAMAMHNSNDLSSTASLVFTELRKLGIKPIRCGVGLFNKESRKSQLYSATSSPDGDSLSLVGWVMMTEHPVLEKIYESWLNNEEYYPELQGEQLRLYYQLFLKGLPVAMPDIDAGKKQYGHFLPFSIGCLNTWSDHPHNESEIKILRRFATIIDLTFRRYLELQKSETSAREAVKQAAVDRIRADIASMRTISDLDRITPLIWNELTVLGINFIRCGVFIMDDSQQLIHTFLSTPDGKAIAAFHLPYTTPGNIQKVISHWHNNKNYIDHWDENAFTEIAEMLVIQGALVSSQQYLKTIPHGGFYLHFLPFLQGMLYVGNINQLSEEEINLIQSVADAFSTAYARYEDFNKLEAAKKEVDSTLNKLQATQKQLIQSEKMASLGELTAGIAHEIQNPLNFVNNFSEVNAELLLEMKDEMDKGNIDDAKAIADDVIENEAKINHHGKRADAIVKGMLQHSRSGTDVKESRDINALADEYLRLSYHGLRAKDKSFNADFKTDFDESIGKINIVPQDIGRVLLNLINNAFYATNEKQKAERLKQNASYKPVVTVSTKKINSPSGDGGIEIIVSDNGNGIPASIKEKIFQPFFTTKPTGQGTGLGLSLSYDIVKSHGGEIKLETKESEGTEFIVHLSV